MSFQMHLLEKSDFRSLRGGDEVNVICGTPIDDLIESLFGPFREEELIFLAPENLTWPHLLARLKCFPSVSQAAKNWKFQKRDLEIRPGFQGPISIGKARKIHIWVWRPIHHE